MDTYFIILTGSRITRTTRTTRNTITTRERKKNHSGCNDNLLALEETRSYELNKTIHYDKASLNRNVILQSAKEHKPRVVSDSRRPTPPS